MKRILFVVGAVAALFATAAIEHVELPPQILPGPPRTYSQPAVLMFDNAQDAPGGQAVVVPHDAWTNLLTRVQALENVVAPLVGLSRMRVAADKRALEAYERGRDARLKAVRKANEELKQKALKARNAPVTGK